MEKAFRPAPLETLARWILKDLEQGEAVLGIPRANFQIPGPRLASERFGHTVAAPLGVAAGPHTQLAQNLVAAWLCGARFMELKTVQILDEIAVSKPCIDAADTTFNCEWSQELKLEESFQEYLKAWLLIHVLAHRMGLPGPGTHFSMSVGYDLEGIQNPRIQAFIANMREGGRALDEAVETLSRVFPEARDLPIPRELSNHVTLSTMHGCPPAEIERIARHLLQDLGLHTWVKLNPTLLGPERLRTLLNGTLGFAEIQVPDEAFAHDPGWEEAMAMVRSLAAEGGPRFGLKLSNTLEVVNHRRVFPEGESRMYLSGRALHPLTLALAHRVAEELQGQVPISFCGGADARNFPDLVASGLGPVTVCTDLLRPGGYARLQPYLINLEAAMDEAGAASLEGFVQGTSGHGPRFHLARQRVRAASEAAYARLERPRTFKGPRPLGAFDCIAAPCMEACPTHQNIPDYLWQVAQGEPGKALEVILRTNPQPGVTGSVCDHPCTERCVRTFFEAPLAIREIKRFAFEHGAPPPPERPRPRNGVKVAIAGAGPAGLSAAYYLARTGFEVEVFEAKGEPFGMVSGVIPGYRLTRETLEADLARLDSLGIRIHLGRALGGGLSLPDLRRDFSHVFLAVGAQRGKRLGIPGEEAGGVLDALAFLDQVRGGAPLELGRRVLVVGGGNSAMDAARSARRLVGDGEVTLVYRRTRAQMPADPAEILDCQEEGIGLRDLLAPARVESREGRITGLACTPMRLGPPDASGRPRPVPAEGPDEVLPADTLITAISQEPLLDFLEGHPLRRDAAGLIEVDPLTRETSLPEVFAGGDAIHGAASVIQAIADGRAVAEAIARRHGLEPEPEPHLDKGEAPGRTLARKGRLLPPRKVPALPLAERQGFREVQGTFSAADAEGEARRCLDCDDLCSLCVTVCPNRANQAYALVPFRLELPLLVQRQGRLEAEGSRSFGVEQGIQTLNIGDFCNDCGNCDTFCPAAGAPYKDKPRFWLDPQAFRESRGHAFHFSRSQGGLRLEARLEGGIHTLEMEGGRARYRGPQATLLLGTAPWSVETWEGRPELPEGASVDLEPCGTLIALLSAAAALPEPLGDRA